MLADLQAQRAKDSQVTGSHSIDNSNKESSSSTTNTLSFSQAYHSTDRLTPVPRQQPTREKKQPSSRATNNQTQPRSQVHSTTENTKLPGASLSTEKCSPSLNRHSQQTTGWTYRSGTGWQHRPSSHALRAVNSETGQAELTLSRQPCLEPLWEHSENPPPSPTRPDY